MRELERCANACAAPAWRLAYAMLRDADEAYDAVQQAFLAAARKPGAIPAGDPWPWFAVVVAHEARNLRRKRRPIPAGVGAGRETTEMDVPDPRAPDPGRAAADADDARRLWSALESLPGPEREAVLLVHVAGLSQAAAAEAIGAPRQTVGDRSQRGLDTLAARLSRETRATAGALAVVPIAAPPQGLVAATASWVETASAGVAETAIQGGTVVASTKGVTIAGIVVAAGLAFVGGGATGALGLFPKASPVAEPGSPRAAPRDPSAAMAPPGEASLAATPEPAPDAVKRLTDENVRLQARVVELERDAATRVAASSRPTEKGPLFTFGEMGRLEAVREADWAALGAASRIVGDSIQEIHRLRRAGEPVPKELQRRLQENTERVRTYEYRTVDKMPTAAVYNGELTHPITATNLLAQILAQAGKGLTASQVAEFDRLGLLFESDFAKVRAAWTPEVPRARRLLDEMRIKGRFMDSLWATLTEEQRPLWVDPAMRGVAGIDLFDPTLMVIHTSPVLGGQNVAEMRTALTKILRPKVGLAEGATEARFDAAVDAFLARATRGLEAVPKAAARNYTYAQAMTAGEASADLVDVLLREFDLSAELEKALLDDPAWYVPRLVTP
jgi:RNA polymerase sigma-70 factor (ECF subfamily)